MIDEFEYLPDLPRFDYDAYLASQHKSTINNRSKELHMNSLKHYRAYTPCADEPPITPPTNAKYVNGQYTTIYPYGALEADTIYNKVVYDILQYNKDLGAGFDLDSYEINEILSRIVFFVLYEYYNKRLYEKLSIHLMYINSHMNSYFQITSLHWDEFDLLQINNIRLDVDLYRVVYDKYASSESCESFIRNIADQLIDALCKQYETVENGGRESFNKTFQHGTIFSHMMPQYKHRYNEDKLLRPEKIRLRDERIAEEKKVVDLKEKFKECKRSNELGIDWSAFVI